MICDSIGDHIRLREALAETIRDSRMLLDVALSDDETQVGIETLMFDLPDGRTVAVEPRENSDGEMALMFVDPDTGTIVDASGIIEGLGP